jgi:hypothetical protein
MRDSDRPRSRRKKTRGSTSRWFQRDERGVPLWAKVGAGAIMLMAVIGLILKGVDRLNKPKSAPNAAVTPAPQTPPLEQPPSTNPPKEPPRTDDPPPKRVRVPIPIPPADEIIARIVNIREAESLLGRPPPDLLVEYDYGSAQPKPHKDVVCFMSGISRTGGMIEATASKGSYRFTARETESTLAGETQFWIERQEDGKFRRITEIYILRR